ncbi:MAG: hypothetical protein QXR76_03405 [Candidatus Bathyarchaeia archaeon]
MSKAPYEITTTAKLSKPLSLKEISNSLLSPAEFDACKTTHYRIIIFNKVLFSGKESVYRAILQIASPKYINDGTIKAEEHEYFNWSLAKKRIISKYGLSNISYVGTKNKVKGIIISSVTSNDTEHQHKIRKIVWDITSKFPNVLFTWEKCLTTIACNAELMSRIKDVKNKGFDAKETNGKG